MAQAHLGDRRRKKGKFSFFSGSNATAKEIAKQSGVNGRIIIIGRKKDDGKLKHIIQYTIKNA